MNDQIRLRETDMDDPDSDDNTPPLGQTHTTNSHTFATFEIVMASPHSDTPPGGLTKIESFLTEDHESRLIDFLGKQTWSEIGNRAVCQFGYTYDFKKRIIKD